MTKETMHPALAELLNTQIRAIEKGVPCDFRLAEAGNQGWNLLKGDLPLPLAVLKQSRLEENGKWMKRFTDVFNVKLAPHGKTTMSPQLFAAQITSGAWGLTAATVDHLRVYRHFGQNRILMANQLVGKHNVGWVLGELEKDPDFEFYCLVDSEEGADLLQRQIDDEKRDQRLNVLIELGVQGGRTGVRNDTAAMGLARKIDRDCPNLILCGIECYEGVLPSTGTQDREANVAGLFARVVKLAEACIEADILRSDKVIVSGAGSEYYDIAAKVFSASRHAHRFDSIIRSGCYISQDHLFYERAFARVVERNTEAAHIPGRLSPALEVWGVVQSLPEPGLAVLNIGKRDVSFDFEMPKPILWFRPGNHASPQDLEGYSISRLNDQHAYCLLPQNAPLRVGDLVALGVAHPCTTFDKWRNIFLVDDNYTVVEAIRTYF
jgi:D-serine dehydratase